MLPGLTHLKRFLRRAPVLGRLAALPVRAMQPIPLLVRQTRDSARWLLTSRETTNLTYELEPLSSQYLISLVSVVTDRTYEEVSEIAAELDGDTELRAHIREAAAKSEHREVTNLAMPFARRLGWYAIARLLKPRVVVETGVDKGIGACLLCAALRRNTAEGHPGKYYGTDINPRAGFLLGGPYAQFGSLLIGDSIDSLRALDYGVDLFINDSDHSELYEATEYSEIAAKLSEDAVVIGDNAHTNDALLRFARQTGRRFLFFQERPRNHWYPGGGMGVAYRPDRRAGR